MHISRRRARRRKWEEAIRSSGQTNTTKLETFISSWDIIQTCSKIRPLRPSSGIRFSGRPVKKQTSNHDYRSFLCDWLSQDEYSNRGRNHKKQLRMGSVTFSELGN